MATILTDIEDVLADLSGASLRDLTVWGSPARNTVALYTYLYKRSADLVDTAVTIDNSAPLTVTEWAFLLAGDGWYRAIVFAFPIWSAGAYALNKAVYYNGNYYYANTSTSGTPGVSVDWTLVTDVLAQILNLANSGVTIGQTNNFTTANVEAGKLGDNLQDLGPLIRTGKCKNINDAVNVLYGEALVDSAWMNFERGDNVEAQQIVDSINPFFQ